MMQSLRYFIIVVLFLMYGCGHIPHSQWGRVRPIQQPTKGNTPSMFERTRRETLVSTRLTKKEYWRPRGTNEEEDDEDKSSRFKKDKKQNQGLIIISGYPAARYGHQVKAACKSCFKSLRPSKNAFFYGISDRLHVLFQVFRI